MPATGILCILEIQNVREYHFCFRMVSHKINIIIQAIREKQIITIYKLYPFSLGSKECSVVVTRSSSILLRNNYHDPLDVNIFGIFRNEKEASFLQENILYSGTTYTLDPGIDTIIEVVYEGNKGTAEKMPDRLPPDSYIIVREQPYLED